MWLKGGREEADAHGGDGDATGRQEHSRDTHNVQQAGWNTTYYLH